MCCSISNRAINLCHVGDAQLLWNDSCAFSQWHADLKDRTVAVWSQLQRGRKLWFVALGRRSLSWFVGSYRRDLLTWAGELKRKWPERHSVMSSFRVRSSTFHLVVHTVSCHLRRPHCCRSILSSQR